MNFISAVKKTKKKEGRLLEQTTANLFIQPSNPDKVQEMITYFAIFVASYFDAPQIHVNYIS